MDTIKCTNLDEILHHFWGLRSLKCTNLDEILHGYPPLSKKCYGAVLTLDHLPPGPGGHETLKAEGNIFEEQKMLSRLRMQRVFIRTHLPDPSHSTPRPEGLETYELIQKQCKVVAFTQKGWGHFAGLRPT